MFGFLRPGCGDARVAEYRRVYAAMCAHQRQQFGQLSSLFHSYEAIFLYHLAVETGACRPPSPETPTCCRLRGDRNNRWQIDRKLADFLSAFAMVLAAVKLEDDVRDSRTWFARISERMLRNRFSNARRKLDEFAPGLPQFIEEKVEEHLRLEQRKTPCPLEQYVEPTAQAFAAVFDAFHHVCHESDPNQQWGQIGHAVGTAIIAADCAVDFERDRKTGQYNPLATRADVAVANDMARRALAQVGWISTTKYDQSVCSFLARSAFDRVSYRSPTGPRRDRGRWMTAQARRGDCDCVCPGEICCEVGNCIDVAQCITCDGPNLGCCCETQEPGCCSSGDCCMGCDPCFACDDCSRRRKKRPDETEDQQLNEESRSQQGTAHGSIDPFGIVKLGGMYVPARANVPIGSGVLVRITEQNSLGVEVAPA